MLLAVLSVIFYALFQTFTVGANLWLSVWSEDQEAGTDPSKRNLYLGVYGALGLLQVNTFSLYNKVTKVRIKEESFLNLAPFLVFLESFSIVMKFV